MATAGDERASYESGEARENYRKKPFRPEINEEPQNVTQEPGKHSSTGVSDQGGNSATTRTSELEQMLKQKAYTRSEVKHQATMENLPDELLSNIFIRLLAKQLAQMRSVSKSWNALISQSSFVKSHLHRSIHNNDEILLVLYHYASYSDQKPFTAHPSRSPDLELTNFIKLPPVNPKSGHNSRIIEVIGSVHGLICSRYGDDFLQIWNPSLSAVSTLPPYLIRSSSDYNISFGLGLIPRPMITRLSSFHAISYSLYAVKEWLQVEVYSMRKGSWELITSRFPSHVIRILDNARVCIDGHDGHLHWSGPIDGEEKLQTIVAFDLGSETFSEMPFPDSVLDNKLRFDALGVLAGKLCVMSWVYSYTNAVCEVWVMEEYGVAESWVKRHVFSQFSFAGSFGFTLHDEFLVEVNVHDEYRDRLVLYDPIAKKTKIFKESGNDVMRYRPDKVVHYTDSLVWVAPVQREMVDCA